MLMKHIYQTVIPFSIRTSVSRIRHNIKRIIREIPLVQKRLGFKKYCPACERSSAQFLDFDLHHLHVSNGIIPPIVVSETLCPWCYSHLHHRLMWTILPGILKDLTLPASGRKLPVVLHFAPERFSVQRLNKLKNIHYIKTDLMHRGVDVQLDMCRIGLACESVDLIIASHVLEHVSNDIVALNELHRILRPGGTAIILVPILVEQTVEHANVTTDEERLRLYGQKHHVRAYGMDLAERIEHCGFNVNVARAQNYPGLNKPNYLLNVQGNVFIARKI